MQLSEQKSGQSKVTTFKTALKADTKVVVNDHLVFEDDFAGMYYSNKKSTNSIIEPPYNPSTLKSLVTRNNILAQCVEAMVVNVDGTGHDVVAIDEQNPGPEEEKDQILAFFSEPYIGESMISIRRKLREDIESIGWGALEVIRTAENGIAFARHVDGVTVRLCRLEDPVPVTKEVVRGKDKIRAVTYVRRRKFVQKVGTAIVYYKEFDTEGVLNRETGEWDEGTPAEKRATEIIYFTCKKDTKTPYGVPRWINQLPSVVGSRKAEEYNLEFFDAGGVPPAVVFVQGGAMGTDVTTQLKAFFSGTAKNKNRIAVVEIASTSGSLDHAGSVSVKTERFGDVKSTDSLFQGYDKNTEEHVRVGFRLPPIFTGRSQDYSFATAYTSYTVTEAQVFQPERDEFDEVINLTMVKVLGGKNYKFKSNPMVIKNFEQQLAALSLVQTMVDKEGFVGEVNKLAGTNVEYAEAEQPTNEFDLQSIANLISGGESTNTPDGEDTQPEDQAVTKAEKSHAIVKLYEFWSVAVGITKGDMPKPTKSYVINLVDGLEGDDRKLFDSMVATKSFIGDGMGDIGAGCADCMCGHDHGSKSR